MVTYNMTTQLFLDISLSREALEHILIAQQGYRTIYSEVRHESTVQVLNKSHGSKETVGSSRRSNVVTVKQRTFHNSYFSYHLFPRA